MKNKKAIALLMVALVLLCGCSKGSTSASEEDNATGGSSSTGIDVENMFTDRDYETSYDESTATAIKLNGTSATSSSKSVAISNSTVTISDEGTYILTGTLSDGQIIVDAEKTDKIQLVLNGATINSATSAAIYVKQADKVFITTAKDSENTLTNGGTFTAIDDSNIDATVFSKDDLTLNGEGSLSIESSAGHGVVSKDDLAITCGTYAISAASQGLSGKNSVRIANGTFSLTAGKDGIHAENADDTSLGFVYIANGTFTIEAQGDGISASQCMQIDDGNFTIEAGGGNENGAKTSSDSYGQFGGGKMGGFADRPNGGGNFDGQTPPGSKTTTESGTTELTATNLATTDGEATASTDDSTSMKGIKAAGTLVIEGGTFTINSADDAVHSNTSIAVNGGTFEIATGDDAFHADESLLISNGTINITTCYEGLEALNVKVSGGDIKLVATDDGVNAAGGADSSGMGGRDNGAFGGGGGMSSSSNGTILITGGTIYIEASGDGLDANGSFEISGGNVTVCGPTQGDTATLDYDTAGTITGGTFIGTGAAGMAQSFSDADQGVIATSSNGQAGTTITLKDSSGNTVLTATPNLAFQVVILSSPDIVSGETYTLVIGSSSTSVKAS